MQGSRSNRWLALGLAAAIAVLGLVTFVSVAFGTRPLRFDTVMDALLRFDGGNDDHLIVRSLRIPRTEVGLMVGIALGLAGTIMQGVTRNPLADPGILGIEAGAALFVVAAIYLLHIDTVLGYVWFAFAGSALAAVIVYGLGAAGREGATPVKLALAGAAVTALLASITSAILLRDVSTFDQFRFWAVGSLAGRDATLARNSCPSSRSAPCWPSRAAAY